jgi:DNA-binding MarR family transcriptional regulator
MAQLDDLEMRAWRAFLGAHSRLVPTLDHELAREMGLNLSQYEVLLRLDGSDGGAMRMAELATEVILSPSGITRAVDLLERRGLVQRRVCQSDRRGFLAVLTDEGKTQLRRASTVHVRGIKEHFTDKMSRAQLAQLAELLETTGALGMPPCEVAS